MKKVLHYLSPLQSKFLNKSFTQKFNLKKKELVDSLKKNKLEFFVHEKNWIYFYSKSKKISSEIVKFYVCVQPNDYWKCIFLLVPLIKEYDLNIKICINKSQLCRPDKIVIYLFHMKDKDFLEKKLIKKLKGIKGHKLHHAQKSKGASYLYWGVDPIFLKTSWRFYRTIVLNWVVENKHHKFFNTNKKKVEWLKKMNISLKHSGPINRIFLNKPLIIKRWEKMIYLRITYYQTLQKELKTKRSFP